MGKEKPRHNSRCLSGEKAEKGFRYGRETLFPKDWDRKTNDQSKGTEKIIGAHKEREETQMYAFEGDTNATGDKLYYRAGHANSEKG